MKRSYLLITALIFLILMLVGSEILLRNLNYHKLRLKPGSFAHSNFILKESDANNFNRSIDWYYRTISDLRANEFLEVEGEKYSFSKKPEIARVLAIGDSGTFGTGLRRNQAWPAQLQSELFDHGNNWEVMNFGIPGALLEDVHRFYTHFLADYRADYVILAIFMANDINQSISLNPQNLKDKIVNPQEYWWQRLALYSFIDLQRMRWQNSDIPMGEKYLTHDKLRLSDFIEGEFALYQQQQDPKTLLAFDKVKSTLMSLKEIIESHGGKLILTFIPTRSYLEDKLNIRPIFDWQRQNLMRYSHDHLDFARPMEQLLSIANELDIEAVNSATHMKSEFGSTVLLENDDHLNFLGSSLLAQELARFLMHDRALKE